MRQLPNLICLLRIVLIWPILAALVRGRFELAAGCFFLAGVSDLMDGALAKRFHWESELGKWLDPSADKLLLASVFISSAWLGLTPVWLTVVVVARDLVIGLGAFAFLAWVGPLKGRPTPASKLNTLVQLAYLQAMMVCHWLGIAGQPLLGALALVTVATTVFSGVEYVRVYARRTWGTPQGT